MSKDKVLEALTKVKLKYYDLLYDSISCEVACHFEDDINEIKELLAQPVKSIYIFPYNSGTISTNFERACKLLGITDLHFHDLRHAAATRLFRTYQIQEVQQFTLHRNWKTLERYTHLKPEDVD